MEDITNKPLQPLQPLQSTSLSPKVEETKTAEVFTKVASAVNYPLMKKEIVWIKRRHTQPVLPVEGVGYDIGRDHRLFIGPAFAGPNSPKLLGRDILTIEEEKKYMPILIGVSPTHQEWDKVLNDYWNTLQVSIPYDGLKMEVGTIQEYEGAPIEPINLFDWILYKYCLRYAQCANTRDMVGASDRIRFYLWKDTEDRNVRAEQLAWKDKASLARLEIINEVEKVKSIIILSGHPVPGTKLERDLLLSDIAESNPQRFIELIADKGLLEKAFVERLVRAQLMTRPLNSTLVVYDSNQIGRNLEEASIWLKQPQNSEVYLSLRQQLERQEA